jgi:hypothetical protein
MHELEMSEGSFVSLENLGFACHYSTSLRTLTSTSSLWLTNSNHGKLKCPLERLPVPPSSKGTWLLESYLGQRKKQQQEKGKKNSECY